MSEPEILVAPNYYDDESKLIWPIGAHPLDQSHLWCPVPLYQWQCDFITAYATQHSRAAESTNNESGKTSILAPICLLSTMVAFRGAMCFATSGSERQVKEQLFEQHIVPVIEPLQGRGWKISKGDLKITAPNASTLLCYVCKDAQKVEGFHGAWAFDRMNRPYYRPCAYWCDESKSINDDIHEAIRRIDPDFWGSVSTPGSMAGWFHDAIDPDGLSEILHARITAAAKMS